MPALFTNQDAAIVELRTKLAKVTAERDRARDIAVALEQEVAEVRSVIAAEIESAASYLALLGSTPPDGDEYANGQRFAYSYAAVHVRAALARGGAA